MIALIDNYDSFTWNLVQQISSLTSAEIEVVRNDAFDPETLLASKAEAIVISPGPGAPSSAGRIVELIRANRKKPLLGVCLGHQAIGEAFGGKIVRGAAPVHGKVTEVTHSGGKLFSELETPFRAARYHSLVIDRASCPENLRVTAESQNGEIMAVAHQKLPIFGIQFHPESFGTDGGDVIVRNFLTIAGVRGLS